jgi:phosphonate transport system permease protein
MTPKNNIVIGIIVGLVIIASYNVEANPLEFAEGLPNLGIVLEEILVLENIIDNMKYVPTALWAILETLQMAFIGTVIGLLEL